jgi:hypothetical protein
MRRIAIASLWITASAGASIYLFLSLDGEGRRLYLPGDTTSGHHQIEDKCEACHTAGEGVAQEACTGCHDQELAEADDSHPPEKFLDPRNAALSRLIDGRRCVTCHIEHRPSQTEAMGVTLPVDFCAACHADIAEERPSHAGLAFDTCQSAGCHNYHDNRALGEAFLADHLSDPTLVARPTVLARSDLPAAGKPLRAADADAPPGGTSSPAVLEEWSATAHANAGVNCTGCHGGAPVAGQPTGPAWTDHPGPEACRGCHADEVTGFLGGKHGMRIAAGLDPMSPADARLPMAPGAEHRELGCASCHGAHSFDTRKAAVEACLGCHADEHSLSYPGSPHEKRWREEQSGVFWAGSGVSCATCHMPRVRRVDGQEPRVVVQHDQNEWLRPVETMVRPVCETCHGVGYSLAALADPALVRNNFRAAPSTPSAAIDMVRRRPKGSNEENKP